MGKSLQKGERPALYKLLDPRTSVVVQMLQHYSSLLMSKCGGGRLRLVWPSKKYHSFATFCEAQPHRCREIRRILMLGAAWVFRRHYVYLNNDTFALTMCGDDQAHPQTLTNFLDFWGERNSCCFPSGICRDFKQMNISPHDLQRGICKDILFWVASTVQLSIADVEAMHSQNRALAGSSLTDIAAKFINAEATRVQNEAVSLGSPAKTAEPNDESGGSSSKRSGIRIQQSLKQPTPKGASPLELFRKHFLDLKNQEQDGNVNPCSKALWKEVKEAFHGLSPTRKSLYESLSKDSKADAYRSRLQRKHQKTNQDTSVAASAATTTTDLVECVGPEGVHLQAVPLQKICDMLSTDADPKSFCNCVKNNGTKQKDNDAIPKANFPVSESSLDGIWRSQASHGISGKDVFKAFQKQAESVARPDDGSDVFPTRVIHEGFCGEQCRHYGEPQRIKLHCHTMELFNYIVAQTQGCIRSLYMIHGWKFFQKAIHCCLYMYGRNFFQKTMHWSHTMYD